MHYMHTLQWNLSNPGTIGADSSVLNLSLYDLVSMQEGMSIHIIYIHVAIMCICCNVCVVYTVKTFYKDTSIHRTFSSVPNSTFLYLAIPNLREPLFNHARIRKGSTLNRSLYRNCST